MVPFGAATQKSMWRYYSHFRPPVESEFFFLQMDGRSMNKKQRDPAGEAPGPAQRR
jgi:hypothetical protein